MKYEKLLNRKILFTKNKFLKIIFFEKQFFTLFIILL
jgi:hypothetical protein